MVHKFNLVEKKINQMHFDCMPFRTRGIGCIHVNGVDYNSSLCWPPFCFANHVTQTEIYLFIVTVFD